jgi:hypothetical protein
VTQSTPCCYELSCCKHHCPPQLLTNPSLPTAQALLPFPPLAGHRYGQQHHCILTVLSPPPTHTQYNTYTPASGDRTLSNVLLTLLITTLGTTTMVLSLTKARFRGRPNLVPSLQGEHSTHEKQGL